MNVFTLEPQVSRPKGTALNRGFFLLAVLSVWLAGVTCASAIQTVYLDTDATVSASPSPQVVFSWDAQKTGVSIQIYRRVMGAADATWVLRGTVAFPTTTFTDSIVEGTVYEYKIRRPYVDASTLEIASYVSVTWNAPLVHDRGRLILVVDQTMASSLSGELTQLEMDLVGDGWTVYRIDFARDGSATPAALRTSIQTAYNLDPTNTKALYLFGRLPIAKSGMLNPDGHYSRAFATDGFYGDMDGTWTDVQNRGTGNVVGDGIYDQDYYPSAVELMVGRVDMAGMTSYPKPEVELLRDYLRKEHAFRTGLRTEVSRNGLYGSGYQWQERNWLLPMMGTSNMTYASFQPTLATSPKLFGVDFGSWDGSGTDYTSTPNKLIFSSNFGSYKLEWNSNNNAMRGLLAQPDWGLTCAWGSRPGWFFHHMSAGLPVGYSALRTMNNSSGTTDYYPNGDYNWMAKYVSINMMGDPSLRLDPVAPPRNVSVTKSGASASLNWTASPDAGVTGYHVYRSSSRLGPYACLTSAAAISGTNYTDDSVPTGDVFYQVRAIKMETHTGTSYANASQGAFAKVKANGTSNRVPTSQSSAVNAPAGQYSEIVFAGSDADGDNLTPIITTNPAKGKLVASGSQTFYLPSSGATGTDTIRYVLSDGVAVSTEAVITITIGASKNLLEWEFGSPAVGITQSMASTMNAAGINATTITLGTWPNLSLYNGNAMWQDDSFCLNYLPRGGFQSTCYVEWIVAPGTNYEYSLERVSFGIWNGDMTKPVQNELRWSDDGFVTSHTVLLGGASTVSWTGNGLGADSGKLYSADLSGISAMQGRATPVAFRLYFWYGVSEHLSGIGKLGATLPDLIISGTAKPLTFETWSSNYSWQGQDSSAGGDPDGDKISNRMEFLLGRNPLLADTLYSQVASETDVSNNMFLSVDYRRRKGVGGIAAQTSPDLATWTNRTIDGSSLIEEVLSADPLGNGTVEDVRLKLLLTPGAGKEFLRLVAP